MNKLLTHYRQFKHQQQGEVIVTSAILMMILVVICGFAIDFSRGVYLKQQLQQASDIGTMACAVSYWNDKDDQKARDDAMRFFDANLPRNAFFGGLSGELHQPLAPSFDVANEVCMLNTAASLPTTMSSPMSADKRIHLNNNASSRISQVNKAIRIALVVDTSEAVLKSISVQKRLASVVGGIAQNALQDDDKKNDKMVIGLVGMHKNAELFGSFTNKQDEITKNLLAAVKEPEKLMQKKKLAKKASLSKGIQEAQAALEDLDSGSLNYANYWHVMVLITNSDDAAATNACRAFKESARNDDRFNKVIISINLGNANATALQDCATSRKTYFNANEGQQVIDTIAGVAFGMKRQLETVRLSR